MINLSQGTIALAQRLASAQGVSLEDAIKQAIEQCARQAGVTEPRREVSPQAIAARNAATQRIVDEIKAMPILDPRPPREIIDDLWRCERMPTDKPVFEILREAKTLAQRYRALTGKPLGITGEVAEYEAARTLRIELTPARQAGYDAIEKENGRVRRLQIKGRCVLSNNPGQRLGSIDTKKEWDAILMVLLDENFDAFEIHEAPRAAVLAALAAPGSKARNERGALSVSKFKRIGKVRWQRDRGASASSATRRIREVS
jgi:hypothetical protein